MFKCTTLAQSSEASSPSQDLSGIVMLKCQSRCSFQLYNAFFFHKNNYVWSILDSIFHFQTSPWRSSCAACRRSVPVRCVWIKKSTSSSSHVGIWWCAKNVRRPWGSVRSAEAWSKAQYGPSCRNWPWAELCVTEIWLNIKSGLCSQSEDVTPL